MEPLRGRVTRTCRTLFPPRAVPQLSRLVIPGGDNVQGMDPRQLELEVSLFLASRCFGRVLDTSVADRVVVVLSH